jgi:NAD(P)-dependent dehydrogenase (short-subunit alcohol dehydrogenase family)
MAGMIDGRAGLAGKVAAIIGGADGVGRAATLVLAEAGVDIAVCDWNEAAADRIRQEVEALGRRCVSTCEDVRDLSSMPRFYDGVARAFDRLDIVVNVAGGVVTQKIEETSAEQNATDIRVNYGYVIDSVKLAVPLIRKGGRGGSIISFTTIEAHRGAAGFAVYAGAKAAITNFSKAAAVEYGPERIRLNTIAPDTTPSVTSRNALPADVLEAYLALPQELRAAGHKMYIPMQVAPTLDDIANAVLFLASDLSRAVTGTTIHVDGGTMAAAGFVRWPFGDGILPSPRAGTLTRLFRDGTE